jgi:N-acetylglucosaminyldiphosphoundecaprenol N-acetyl-beta-D-mannosaminyltransferase
MSPEVLPPIKNVIGFPVTALPFDEQITLMLQWAEKRLSKVVCVANVHMLMEAHSNPKFAEMLLDADLVTPDGMPLVWLMNWMGVRQQDRVAGMDILMALCRQAASAGMSVFFLGSDPETLERMRYRLERDFPTLKIAGMEPLPFRPLTSEEDSVVIQKINACGAGLVLVSLGCPKQEIWMNQHKGKIRAVMLGLGGAFPVYAGLRKWAPIWVRNAGLEWLYRLVQEPRRLWKRYFGTIPPFIYLAIKQVLAERSHPPLSEDSKYENDQMLEEMGS